MQTFLVPFAALVVLAADPAMAAYRYTTIDAPSPAALATVVSGINNHGVATGFTILAAATPADPFATIDESFTVNADGGGYTRLVRPGFEQTSANAINDDGVVAGISLHATDDGAVGFVRAADGSYTTVDVTAGGLDAIFTEATGINAAGTVVGYYTSVLPPVAGVTPVHGFILNGGIFSQFDVPVDIGQQTRLFSINASGTVTGDYRGLGDDAVNGHGFIWSASGGFVYMPGTPGAGSDIAGINDFGDFLYADVVNDPFSPLEVDAASYVVHGGVYTPIAVPRAFVTEALGINNRRDVTGTYVDATGVHGFIATDVPEPASWALLVVGFGVTGVLARRARRHDLLCRH